jgi:hypothetical protein
MISKTCKKLCKKLLSDFLSNIGLLTACFNEFPITNPEFSKNFGSISTNLICFDETEIKKEDSSKRN